MFLNIHEYILVYSKFRMEFKNEYEFYLFFRIKNHVDDYTKQHEMVDFYASQNFLKPFAHITKDTVGHLLIYIYIAVHDLSYATKNYLVNRNRFRFK